jgi:hypothetical protein
MTNNRSPSDEEYGSDTTLIDSAGSHIDETIHLCFSEFLTTLISCTNLRLYVPFPIRISDTLRSNPPEKQKRTMELKEEVEDSRLDARFRTAVGNSLYFDFKLFWN